MPRRLFRRASCLVIVVGWFAAHAAGAQIVNVQGQLAKAPEQDGTSGQVEAKLDWRDGNTSVIEVGVSASVLVRRGKLLGVGIVRAEYGESRDVTFSRKTFEHVRGRYTLDERWRWEAFLQHEYDAFRRLSVRAIAGTGPAFQIFNQKAGALLAGAAYMVEYESLDKRSGTIDAGLRTLDHRASIYATGVQRLGAQVSAIETIYVQPRLDDFEDIRLLGELAVTSKVSKHIALTDGLTIAYDRTPPDGIQRRDVTLKIGAIVSF
ncbi:MAG: DUF481 domain-containing protein [Kofleriaceae bacterium]